MTNDLLEEKPLSLAMLLDVKSSTDETCIAAALVLSLNYSPQVGKIIACDLLRKI